MADKVGSVYIEIQAKMGSLEKDLKSLEARLQGVDGKAQQTASSFMSMGKMIGGSLITGAVIGLGKAALEASAKMEQNRVAFTTMLGSGDKANKLLQDMTKFAAATPFQLNDIIDAGKSLTAFGVASEKIIPTLTKLGDISAALNIPIRELSDLYGKARVQGTLYAEDLNQLAGRGIPIFTELAKVMGVNSSEVKKLGSEGKITFKELDSAIANMTKEGSQFGGLMEAQSQTLGGQWSNFGDNLDRIATTLGDKLAPAAKEALGFLNVMFESDTAQFSREMQGMVDNVQLLIKYNKQYGQDKMDQSGFKDELLATERLRGILVPINATAEQRLAIYKQIATMSREEAQIMGLISGGEEIRSKLAASDLDIFKKKGELTKEQIKEQLKANREAARGNVGPETKSAWAKKKREEEEALKERQKMIDEYGSVEMAKFIADLDNKVAKYQQYTGVLTNMSGQLAQLSQMNAQNQTAEVDNRLNKELDAINERYETEKALIEESLLTEEEKNAKLKALDESRARDEKAAKDKAEKEKRKIAREAAKQQKVLAIFDTIIATPTAAFQSYKALAGIPIVGPALGMAAAAAATALGLAKIKMINDQPLPALAEGGIVPAVPGGNQFTIGEAGSAEAVIPLNDNTLSRLANMINSAGGGGSSMMNITLNVDGETFGNWMYKATKNGQATISRNGVVA